MKIITSQGLYLGMNIAISPFYRLYDRRACEHLMNIFFVTIVSVE